MNPTLRTLVAVVAATQLSGLAFAETWEIDNSHSNVGFSIRHLMVSNVKGSFKAFGGTIEYFVENVFNYPTLAECYKVAALYAMNRMGAWEDGAALV